MKNSLGNKSGVASPAQVKRVRNQLKGDPHLLNAAALLKQHPHK